MVKILRFPIPEFRKFRDDLEWEHHIVGATIDSSPNTMATLINQWRVMEEDGFPTIPLKRPPTYDKRK